MFSKEDYNTKFLSLTNKKLIRVYYLQLNYKDNQPYWNNFSQEFDYLDYGLVFEFENKTFFEIIWDSVFYQFGLSCKQIDNLLDSDNNKVWDVTFNNSWKDLNNLKIIDVKVFWETASEGNQEFDYPQDLELTFENNKRIYLSASAYIKEDDKFVDYSDEVVVIFNQEIAKKYKVCSFRNINKA